ncbi:hypothetical protein BU15DRAFT_64253 [Melanogaster broomeanus]|nr:hypothetical protein BU15DRAFT_64253 [Melanogaster broomeanus]
MYIGKGLKRSGQDLHDEEAESVCETPSQMPWDGGKMCDPCTSIKQACSMSAGRSKGKAKAEMTAASRTSRAVRAGTSGRQASPESDSIQVDEDPAPQPTKKTVSTRAKLEEAGHDDGGQGPTQV